MNTRSKPPVFRNKMFRLNEDDDDALLALFNSLGFRTQEEGFRYMIKRFIEVEGQKLLKAREACTTPKSKKKSG